MSYYVSSGQVSTGIILNINDYMYIYSGGTANSTTVNRVGYLYVSSGGVANSTTVNYWGDLYVYSGGVANSTTVNSGGELYVFNGGVANSTTMNGGGCMYISSGGVGLAIKENGGYVEIADGASATFVANSFSGLVLTGSATLHSGTTANSTTVNSGYLVVYSGGTANKTTVNWNGGLYIYSGGVANSTTVNGWGYMYISSGGVANSTTMNSGVTYVSSGGVANSTTVNSSYLVVFSGGVANSTTVNRSGWMRVYNGGTALNVAWTPCVGRVSVDNGATVTFTSSYRGVYFGSNDQLLSSAMTMTGKTLAGHSMYVMNGGTANKTTVSSGGYLYVSNGGTANKTTVSSGGKLYVSNGGTAYDVTILAGGVLGAFSWQTSRHVGVIENGSATVAKNVTIVGNSMYIFSGGVANETTVNRSGWMYVSSGGVANSTTLNDDDSYLVVYSGGVANSTTVDYWCDLTVSSGGTANETTVNYGGWLTVDYGGVANDTTVSGGYLYVSSGGKITGALTIAHAATVSAYMGGIIDFDISPLTQDAAARVNDLSLIQGAPNYTVTVSAAQAVGTYTLAGGAADFYETITVNTDGTTLGTVSVGETLEASGYTYSLSQNDGTLSLTVAGGSPVPAAFTAGDLNGDGRADIVMTIAQDGHPADGSTGAWLIQADQTAAWGDLSQRNAGWEIFGTGITAAGKETNDMYVKSSENVIGAWVTNGTGAVAGWETVGEFDATTNVLGLGDFNGDGQTDLLLRNDNGAVGCFFTSGDVTGWNYFQSLGDEWTVSAVGDLNGDGRDDVVLKHDAGFAGSWLTQSDYTMAWANLDTLQNGFTIVGAGDFNGDGTDDVLLQNGTYYGAWMVENGSVKSWMGLGDLGTATVEEIADFDADGVADLRIRTAAGDLGAQLVKGADTLDWKYYGSVGEEWRTALAAI